MPSSSPSKEPAPYPITPDGHYFLWNGWQLWRCANPALPAEQRDSLTKDLMAARRAVRTASKLASPSARSEALAKARADVQRAKERLGERGPVWWDEEEDGGAVVDRKHVKNTQYKDWAKSLGVLGGDGAEGKRETVGKKSKRRRVDDQDDGADEGQPDNDKETSVVKAPRTTRSASARNARNARNARRAQDS